MPLGGFSSSLCKRLPEGKHPSSSYFKDLRVPFGYQGLEHPFYFIISGRKGQASEQGRDHQIFESDPGWLMMWNMWIVSIVSTCFHHFLPMRMPSDSCEIPGSTCHQFRMHPIWGCSGWPVGRTSRCRWTRWAMEICRFGPSMSRSDMWPGMVLYISVYDYMIWELWLYHI